MKVAAAVRKGELAALKATADALSAIIDDGGNSATSRTMAARELRETLARIRELAPPAARADRVDRLAASAAAKLRVAK